MPTSITVWQETVNVSSSTDYTFSGWAASWGKNGDIFTDASPAQLEFLVNGVQIGSEFTLIAGDGQWSQFSASWNSATSTTATIQIVDMNTASFGNDFAVDDLIFDTSGAVYPQLVVTTQPPASVATGAGFGITVTAETSPGSVDTGFNGTVTAVLEENPTLATLGGTLTATATDGVATFSGLTIDTVGTAYTLLAWASGLVSAETNTFDVTAAPVPLLDVTTQPPSSVTAGSDFGLTVTAETSPGTVDTGFTGTVTVALENNPTGATLGGTVTATATDGVATFSTLLLDTAGTGYTLMATANGLTSAETDSFDVTPSAATQLVVTSQPPTDVVAGTGFGLVVTAEDQFQNQATSFSGSVAVAILNNPGGSTLSGTLSVTAQNGVATFSGLSLNNVAVGDTLQVTSSGLTSATTNAFDVQTTVAGVAVGWGTRTAALHCR